MLVIKEGSIYWVFIGRGWRVFVVRGRDCQGAISYARLASPAYHNHRFGLEVGLETLRGDLLSSLDPSHDLLLAPKQVVLVEFGGPPVIFVQVLKKPSDIRGVPAAGQLEQGLLPTADLLPPHRTWLFLQIGGPFLGILIMRTLLFGVCIQAADFWRLPIRGFWSCCTDGCLLSHLRRKREKQE